MEDKEIKLLVEQARLSDDRAFGKLYKLYYPKMWNTAFYIVKNKDITDDIVSTAFTKAYLKLNTYVNHISFEMWLKTITINTAIDCIRNLKKEKLNQYIDAEDNFIQLDGLENSPEDGMIAQQTVDTVLAAIPRLKKKYRDLISLKLDGKSYKEIAEVLALPENTVKTGLNKARQRLKQIITNII